MVSLLCKIYVVTLLKFSLSMKHIILLIFLSQLKYKIGTKLPSYVVMMNSKKIVWMFYLIIHFHLCRKSFKVQKFAELGTHLEMCSTSSFVFQKVKKKPYGIWKAMHHDIIR